jgi:heavy metal sensor kinase
MKRLSIRSRVTIWYTVLMLLLVAVTLFFMVTASEQMMKASTESRLTREVEEGFDELHIQGNQLTGKGVETYQDGIYLMVYNSDGTLIYGSLPDSFDGQASFQDRTVQTVKSNGVTFYVYDVQRNVKNSGLIWVRGIVSTEDSENTFVALRNLALVTLPCLVVLAALGGYFLTGRAFRPVKKIAETARQIGDGNDLTRRFELGDSKDEIHALAESFNYMFDRLQTSFEGERQFTSDASHELRTPVSVIISQCEYVLEDCNTEEEYREALQTVLGQARKMSGLISQLLALARADQGREQLRLETVNLSELCHMVSEELREQAEVKKISLQTDIQPDLSLLGDETLLMRMLINLISNGITYGRENGTLTVSLTRQGDRLVGSVKDDGIGIPAESLGHIWDRFYQVDSARSGGGAGLGLSMVKWIAETHGGAVSVESEAGKGSTFLFTLPV